MDQREPLRNGMTEGGPPEAVVSAGPARRFPRLLTSTSAPSPSSQRMALYVAAAVGMFLVLAGVLFATYRNAVSYVVNHPDFMTSATEIILDPPPEPWFLGGKDAFLKSVAAGSNLPARFSVLEIDPERVENAFKRHPWVFAVEGVFKGSDGTLRVKLVYRQPVAIARFPGESDFVLDAYGVLLPREDLDLAKVGPLIFLEKKFAKPSEPVYGESWQEIDPSTHISRANPQVLNGARLAGFLRSKLNEDPLGTGPAPPVFLHANASSYFVQVGPRVMIRWEEPSASGATEELSNEEKWAIFRSWWRQFGAEAKSAVHKRFRQKTLVDDLSPPPTPKPAGS